MGKDFLEKAETELKRLETEYKRHAELHRRNARKWLLYMFITLFVYLLMVYFLPYPILCGQ